MNVGCREATRFPTTSAAMAQEASVYQGCGGCGPYAYLGLSWQTTSRHIFDSALFRVRDGVTEGGNQRSTRSITVEPCEPSGETEGAEAHRLASQLCSRRLSRLPRMWDPGRELILITVARGCGNWRCAPVQSQFCELLMCWQILQSSVGLPAVPY